jgi:peptide/nickel transport system substrate-binding protein
MVRAKQIGDGCCFDSSPLSTYRVLREKLHSRVEGPWWQGYANSEVDTLIDMAATTVDDADRQAIYRRAYRLIRDDAPWIFLYSPLLVDGAGPRLTGWQPGINGLARFG